MVTLQQPSPRSPTRRKRTPDYAQRANPFAFPEPPPSPPKPTPFLFSSLRSVWQGLCSVAGTEVAGFVRGVTGTQPELGRKRSRSVSSTSSISRPSLEGFEEAQNEQRDSKRRKTMEGEQDFEHPRPAPTPPIPSPPLGGQVSTSYKPTQTPSISPPSIRPRSALKSSGLRSVSGKRPIATPSVANPVAYSHHVRFAVPPTSSTFTFPPKPPTSAPFPSSSSGTPAKKQKKHEAVDTMLFGQLSGEFSQAWKHAKEEDRRSKDQKRIEELEEEVKRLKGELSAKSKVEPTSSGAPSTSSSIFNSPFKSSGAVPPPPPLPPPPPPIGFKNTSWKDRNGPGQVISGARASLKSTPPTKPKGRQPALGPSNVDMGAFMSEISNVKLKKVSRELVKPVEKKSGGDFQNVLQQAFSRKFAKTHDTPVRSNIVAPDSDWSTPRPIASSSGTHPPVSPTLPAATTRTVFGEALTTNSISSQRGHSRTASSTSFERPRPAAPVVGMAPPTPMSNTESVDGSTTPPSEPREARSIMPPQRTSSLAVRSLLESPPPQSGLHPSQDAAAERLAHRARTTPTPPDINVGSLRPVTPGRKKAALAKEERRSAKKSAQKSSGKSLKHARAPSSAGIEGAFFYGGASSSAGSITFDAARPVRTLPKSSRSSSSSKVRNIKEQDFAPESDSGEYVGCGTRKPDPLAAVARGVEPGVALGGSGMEWVKGRQEGWGLSASWDQAQD